MTSEVEFWGQMGIDTFLFDFNVDFWKVECFCLGVFVVNVNRKDKRHMEETYNLSKVFTF